MHLAISPGRLAAVVHAPSTSSGVTRLFAPGDTTIELSPSAPTAISATPFGTELVVRRWAVSTPSASRAARRIVPPSSSPSRPIIATDVTGNHLDADRIGEPEGYYRGVVK